MVHGINKSSFDISYINSNMEGNRMKLDKETIKWLRTYGYTLNSDEVRYQKIKSKIKEIDPYSYYFYVDLDIKQEAEKIFSENDGRTKEFYKSFKRKFNAEKRRLIKELYGLEKRY